jgi:hypothetical protein
MQSVWRDGSSMIRYRRSSLRIEDGGVSKVIIKFSHKLWVGDAESLRLINRGYGDGTWVH